MVDLAPPDEDEDQPTPPRTGYLFLSLSGDKARLSRRESAEEALRTGNCPLPQLGLLMEGRPAPAARRGKISVRSPKLRAVIRDVFGENKPTQRQLEAIERALNTPDVCLIQGPPGTGKTKVITAIERCLAVLADEGVEPSHRILVTAAQHDAVENVVQRTEVFGLPAVKVGRRRRGSDTAVDPVQVFADERVEELRARVRTPPEAARLSKARGLVVACFRTRSLPAEQAGRIREIVSVLGELVPPALRDQATDRAATLAEYDGRARPGRALAGALGVAARSHRGRRRPPRLAVERAGHRPQCPAPGRPANSQIHRSRRPRRTPLALGRSRRAPRRAPPLPGPARPGAWRPGRCRAGPRPQSCEPSRFGAPAARSAAARRWASPSARAPSPP